MARPREYEDRYDAVMHLLSLGWTVRDVGDALQMGKSTVQRMKKRGKEILSAAGDFAVAIVADDIEIPVKPPGSWIKRREKPRPKMPAMSHAMNKAYSKGRWCEEISLEAEEIIPEIDYPTGNLS